MRAEVGEAEQCGTPRRNAVQLLQGGGGVEVGCRGSRLDRVAVREGDACLISDEAGPGLVLEEDDVVLGVPWGVHDLEGAPGTQGNAGSLIEGLDPHGIDGIDGPPVLAHALLAEGASGRGNQSRRIGEVRRAA